jgi:hypothetical protein
LSKVRQLSAHIPRKEEANVETKYIKQDSAPERGGENIERGPIIQTGKKVAINKWIQSS